MENNEQIVRNWCLDNTHIIIEFLIEHSAFFNRKAHVLLTTFKHEILEKQLHHYISVHCSKDTGLSTEDVLSYIESINWKDIL